MTIDLLEVEKVIRKSENDPTLKIFLIDKLKETDDPIAWYKILNSFDFFTPEKNPKPIETEEGVYRIPFWSELSLLERYSTIKTFISEPEILEEVMQFIDDVISYRDVNGVKIDNYSTDWMLIKLIFNLPINKIKIEYIDFIGMAYTSRRDVALINGEMVNSIIPKIINARSKQVLLEVLDVLLNYKLISYEGVDFNDFVSIMDEFWFNEMISKYSNDFYDICGIDLLYKIENKILDLIKKKNMEFSIAQVVTIEDSDQNLNQSYEINMIRLIRDLLIYLDVNEIKSDLLRFLKSEHSIFRRLVIYLINVKYSELDYLIWSYSGNPINDIEIKHELWELFSNNSKLFEARIMTVINWIESNEYYIAEEIKENKEMVKKIIAYKKKEWYYSLLSSEVIIVKEKYDHYDSINPIKLDHPGYSIWSSGVMSVSPFKEVGSDFIQLDNAELVQHLNAMQDAEGSIFGFEPKLSIRELVKENPIKFTNDMEPLTGLNQKYLYDLFIGLKEAWSQNSDFDWNEVFTFINAVLPIIDGWETEKIKYDYNNWTIQKIAELIEEGCKRDEHSFDDELITIAARALIKLDNICKTKISYNKKIIDYVINSSKGAIYTAMILVSLKNARFNKKKVWINEIEEYFTLIINNSHLQSYEFYFIIGRFFNNILYMKEKWIMDHYNSIFDIIDDDIWASSFQGYLSGSKLTISTYYLLKEKGDYSKALTFNFENNMIDRILMNHMANSYLLEGVSPFKNELMKIIIDELDNDKISHISHFYWKNRDELSDDHRELVIDLWRTIINSISKKEQYVNIYNSLSYLIGIINQLDEVKIKILMETSKYMDLKSPYSLFTDNLIRLLEQNPNAIGNIYLFISEKDEYPFAREDSIKTLVEQLYNSDEKEIANKICRVYAAKGFLFLKETFEKNK